MEIIKLILFLYIFSLYFSKNIYKPDEVINYFNKEFLQQDILENIKNNISKILNDFYAFYEISKNPPQPDFDKNYHNIVDLKKEISEIETKDVKFYKFYQDLKKILTSTRDGHLYLDLLNFKERLKQFIFVSPIHLNITEINGEIKIFGINNILPEYYSKFRNNEDIFPLIDKNQNIPIRSINGKNPFNFISDFGNNYLDFRSPHANFAFKYALTDNCHFSAFPLSYEDLVNYNVVYENGESFTTDYIIESDLNIYENQDDNILLKNNKVNFEKKKFFFPNKYEIIKDLKKNSEITLHINSEIEDKNLLEDNKIRWNYNYEDIFKCRVDSKNEINVYFIKSFMGDDINLFINTIKECGELFDSNTYPVTLISNINSGGLVDISALLLEILSPFTTSKIYTSFRKTDTFFKLVQKSSDIVPDANCENKELKYLFENGKLIDYGNNVKDTISDIFLLKGKEFRGELDKFKQKLKNKRRPTEIIVIADGFSFSATSLFLKYLQYYGGGITVGIFGHPDKSNIPFDSSLSPSAIFTNETLNVLSKDYKLLYEKYNLFMQMAGYQTFYNPNHINIPLEYVITPVDEVEPFYELLDDNNYEKYIKIAKNKYNKYKTQCNPKNKKLVNINKECDKFFDNKYTHGGYECGDNGKWTSKCVASYCDIGYIFDHEKGKCIIDYCSAIIESNAFFLITIISLIISFLVIIFVVIIILFANKNKNDLDYDDITKISLSIQDRDDIKLYYKY